MNVKAKKKIDLRADPEIDDVVSISALTRSRVGCVMRKSYIAKISMIHADTRVQYKLQNFLNIEDNPKFAKHMRSLHILIYIKVFRTKRKCKFL